MAVKLISMRNMCDDEADDIQHLLEKHHIDFYITPAGLWGISMPTLWLSNNDDLQEASKLLADYETQRGEKERQIYAKKKASGEHITFWDNLKNQPFHFIFYMGLTLFILYVSIIPFFELTLF